MENKIYNKSFYEGQKDGSLKSAEVIVPYIKELLNPQSVLDVGCGVGTWLSVFREKKIKTFGLDGNYVQKEQLLIPENEFLAIDLEKFSTKDISGTFDLALSLEVAEHLTPSAGKNLVHQLTTIAPAVVFSAAIVGQGGTNHINEQWPNYWAEIFKEHGFIAIDCFREKYWEAPDVQYWYAQNMVLYVSRKFLDSHPTLNSYTKETLNAYIHPKLYSQRHPYLTPRPIHLIISTIAYVISNVFRK